MFNRDLLIFKSFEYVKDRIKHKFKNSQTYLAF